jgi:hypothetical protein
MKLFYVQDKSVDKLNLSRYLALNILICPGQNDGFQKFDQVAGYRCESHRRLAGRRFHLPVPAQPQLSAPAGQLSTVALPVPGQGDSGGEHGEPLRLHRPV